MGTKKASSCFLTTTKNQHYHYNFCSYINNSDNFHPLQSLKKNWGNNKSFVQKAYVNIKIKNLLLYDGTIYATKEYIKRKL